MRVAIDATPLAGDRTGVGNFVDGALHALAEYRRELKVKAFAVTFSGRGEVGSRLPSGVKLCRLPMAARRLRRRWMEHDSPYIELWTHRIDVVHGTNFVVPPAHHAAEVVTVHDLSPIVHPEYYAPDCADYENLIRRALDRNAMIHTPSMYVALEVMEMFGLDQSRVRAVPHGVPTYERAKGPPKLPARRAPYLLAVGTVQPRKQLATLVEAFDAIAHNHPTVDLVIAGKADSGEPALARAIDGARHSTRIDRLGWVEPADCANLIQNALALAYPSEYEGFGFPPLEAMAHGVPVVATRAGAVPEIVGDGALLVPVGDVDRLAQAISKILGDEAERARLAAAGFRRVKHFNWRKCADGLVDLYRAAIDAR